MTDQAAPPRGCPDPSVLAAFVEGRLDERARREVERHVADCPECPTVIGETARFLQLEAEEADADDPPASASRNWWWLAAAAFAAFCITGVAWQSVMNRDPLVRVRTIAATLPVRTVEGQLSGFAHVPFSSPRSDVKPVPNAKLREVAESLADSDPADARVLHARGVAQLLMGDKSAAIASLEAASRQEPRDAAFWSDLAAAHLAAGAVGDRDELTRALAAANRAVALAPKSPAAHFNRALALEHLGDRAAAAATYRRALQHTSDEQWRSEITHRLAQIGA